jgi:hypothetical protein
MRLELTQSSCEKSKNSTLCNLVPRACDPRDPTWGYGIIRCRKSGILAKTEPRIPYQRPIRFLPETDYPRASRSFPRIAGSGNEIERSAESRGFSPGTPVSSHRESLQAGVGKKGPQ